jgi:ankyrin repeat protein
MSNPQLPERASLEYLKKLAKDRLRELRRADPHAKLADALLAVARDHGFSSWRALKAEVDRRLSDTAAQFLAAIRGGDVQAVRDFLDHDPGLVRAALGTGHGGWTALHEAAKRGHTAVANLLLQRGADPNAREAGDNTYPLHWAAAHGNLEIVRALLDAGGDVHGLGDVHQLDAIGWASGPGHLDVVSLLIERGAKHHIFSALAVGDPELIRQLVEENPEALDRRQSMFEEGRTPLHFAIQRKRYDLLDLLIELGADVDAPDGVGRTALDVAILRNDRVAIDRLRAAGARELHIVPAPDFRASVAKLAESTRKLVLSMAVPDIAKTLDWYRAIGFKELGRFADDGVVNWGMVAFGKAELMLGTQGKVDARQPASFWFYMDNVAELYQLFRSRQLQDPVEFDEDLYEPFYGGRQFSIRDLNGYSLIFYQEQL